MSGTAVKMQRSRGASAEERLVKRCQQGDQEAWSALIDKYKNLIYSIPIKLGMYQDAGDVFQSVCLDLLVALPKLREPRALPKWLMQTCYHRCLHYKRGAEKHIGFEESEAVHSEIESKAAIPEEMLAQLEQEQALRDVMAELPSRCAQMIRMLFFEAPPRPYQEIAKQLGLANGSIGFIRGRCLKRLRKELEKMGFG